MGRGEKEGRKERVWQEEEEERKKGGFSVQGRAMTTQCRPPTSRWVLVCGRAARHRDKTWDAGYK